MNDAFERRALLLHLGDVLHAIDAALHAHHATLKHLLKTETALAQHAWLRAITPELPAANFARRASTAFANWPALLLEAEVDYARLAADVHDHLFVDDDEGWLTYVAAMKPEVAWFGDDLPAAHGRTAAQPSASEPRASKSVQKGTQTNTQANTQTSTEESTDESEAASAHVSSDIERAAEDTTLPARENVERPDESGRLYPSWPWKPGV